MIFCLLTGLRTCLFCLYALFFFKQKTAYELRIGGWSSDVGSSVLAPHAIDGIPHRPDGERRFPVILHERDEQGLGQFGRAACREECVRTCSSRWSPHH